MKKLRYFIIPLFIITLVLEGANVYLSNQVATESVTVSSLTSNIEELERVNFVLKSEYLKYSSIEHVASRAAELGFTDSKKTISLYDPLKVAIR